MAALLGVNVDRTISVTFIMGAALAAVAGTMSRKSDMAAPAARTHLGLAAKDAILTAVLTFFLLLPLIGFKTVQDIRNELALETRWSLLFGFVALAVSGRLFYSLIVAPWLAHRAAQPRQPSEAAIRLRGALARWFAPFAIGFV